MSYNFHSTELDFSFCHFFWLAIDHHGVRYEKHLAFHYQWHIFLLIILRVGTGSNNGTAVSSVLSMSSLIKRSPSCHMLYILSAMRQRYLRTTICISCPADSSSKFDLTARILEKVCPSSCPALLQLQRLHGLISQPSPTSPSAAPRSPPFSSLLSTPSYSPASLQPCPDGGDKTGHNNWPEVNPCKYIWHYKNL